MTPDICTLIVATVTTTQACMLPAHCDDPRDGKVFCVPDTVAVCPAPQPYFDCVQPDGFHYTVPWTAHPMEPQ